MIRRRFLGITIGGRLCVICTILATIFITTLLSSCDLLPIKRYRIPQEGMYPTLPARSNFFARMHPYAKVADVKCGDIVLFRRSNKPDYVFVWRVVGIPGDSVVVEGTTVVLNGRALERTMRGTAGSYEISFEHNGEARYRVAYQTDEKEDRRGKVTVLVPPGEFFLLGDNRDNAWDSRFTGCVPFAEIFAKAIGVNDTT